MNTLRRIPPVIILLVGLVAAALSIGGVIWPWCSVAAGILTIVVVSVQYKTQGSTIVSFTTDDWKKEGASFLFSAGQQHGKGSKPVASVYMPLSGGGYEEVICDVHTLESGEVILGAGSPFNGEVRID
ncbi:MAG: hypothetical protein WBR33_19545 [Pseudonocardiaceae bacterium]